ncbi:MAG: nucleoside-diphosphate sugar epimerase [Omnitrophica bacterium RIFCSPLOWO2_01_FULL_45_10]|nr:MAG: nucleoside-diphosphate sugar epimerase [Omnitrophica bacterium RIFCSPLOWO2_01_FULL_45_10]
MKALVTGGAGFIGSHLCERLLNKKWRVSAIDNLSTGSIENIKRLEHNKGFHFIMNDIMNEKVMARLIKNSDIVFHLAAAVGVKYIIDNPLDSIRTNVKGTEIILELANAIEKKKVVLASTSEVYGKDRPGKKCFRENDDRVMGSTTITRWSYACTKALDEFLALAYWREKKLPVIIVRFFNTCGPRQTGRYGMVIPRFIKQALLNKPITVYGDGGQTRCFLYIDDAVNAVTGLVNEPEAVGEVFNVGNPESITILNLAKKIKKFTNSSSKIEFVPYERAYEKGFEDMRHRKPDISKIKTFINFSPQVHIDELLKRTIKFFQK